MSGIASKPRLSAYLANPDCSFTSVQGPCFVVYSLLGQPGGSRIPVPRENLAKFVDALIPLSHVHGAQRL